MTVDPSSHPVTVTIPNLGSIQGLTKNGVTSFLNVPFGVIPERWRHAVHVEPWEGVRDGTVEGPMCPQENIPNLFDKLLNRPAEESLAEYSAMKFDEKYCLNVNIYTPEASILANDNVYKLPVMVWVHGGALRNGGNNMTLYDASNFVKHSIHINDPVVVVVMNYRVHYLGFMSSTELLADDRASDNLGMVGNWGLTDQKLGFQWVRQHIQAFGGNSQDVTAFGESAGAVSLGYHLTLKKHHGLFDKVILQSGSSATMSAGTLEHGQLYFDHLCKVLLTKEQNRKLSGVDKVNALRQVPIEALEQEMSKVTTDFALFLPTEDGELIDYNIRTGVADPSRYDPNLVRIMAGTCKDEGSLFAELLGGSTLEKWHVLKSRLVGSLDNEKNKDFHELFDKCYGVPQVDMEGLLASAQVVSDAVFNYPTFTSARAVGQQSTKTMVHNKDLVSNHWPRVTTYHWNREIDAIAKFGLPVGAHHAVELPFVFRSPAVLEYLTEQEQEFSKQVQEIWIRFATGSESSAPKLNHPDRESIVFGQDCAISTTLTPRLSEDKVKLWEQINAYVQAEIDAGRTEVGMPTYCSLA